MLKIIIPALLVTLASGCSTQAQPTTTAPASDQVFAWYQDGGFADNVKSWKSVGITGEPQDLARIVGSPRTLSVKTASGEKKVISLDGSSALWQASDKWKEIKGDVSVVALVRLKSLQDGFLFDGSAGVGLTRAQVRGGNWQIGSQPANNSAATNAGKVDSVTLKAVANVWQTHAFVFRQDARTASHTLDGETKTVPLGADSPLSGFIIGANGAAKSGLRADVAELMVFDRALSNAEIANMASYLKAKWGTPEIVFNAELASADKAALSAKLADKSKPLIWMWSGQNTAKNLGNARNEPQQFAERVRFEMGRRRDIMIDTRTQAATASDKSLDEHLARFNPSIVILEPGAETNITAMIERVRKSGAIPIVLGSASQGETLRKTAGETGTVLVEVKPVSGDAAQKSLNQAVALMRALGIDDEKSATQKMLKP